MAGFQNRRGFGASFGPFCVVRRGLAPERETLFSKPFRLALSLRGRVSCLRARRTFCSCRKYAKTRSRRKPFRRGSLLENPPSTADQREGGDPPFGNPPGGGARLKKQAAFGNPPGGEAQLEKQAAFGKPPGVGCGGSAKCPWKPARGGVRRGWGDPLFGKHAGGENGGECKIRRGTGRPVPRRGRQVRRWSEGTLSFPRCDSRCAA